MNLETAKLLATMTGTHQIYRESAPFHIRGVATEITFYSDVHADDWKVCPKGKVDKYTERRAGMIRGFYLLSESWYADANRRPDRVDSLMIGFYGPDGDQGTAGEFEIEWTELGGKIVPQLRVYDDGWQALSHFRDMLDAMAELDNTNISPQNFCKVLIALGIKDLTRREVPMHNSR